MKDGTRQLLETYCKKYGFINEIKQEVEIAYRMLFDCYDEGHKLLICGNGGSNADADHITGELCKGFLRKRPLKEKETFQRFGEEGEYLYKHLQGGLPAINLGAHGSLATAVINDMDGQLIFAQQVHSLGRPGDVLMGISTSGNSQNVLFAGITAKIKGMKFIGLTGGNGGKMEELADCLIKAPSKNTPDIQDMHTPIYHMICAMVENEFWDE